MNPSRRSLIALLALLPALTGCFGEKEPNGTTAEAWANNAFPLWEPGQPQGALYLGTKEPGGEDNWIIFINAPTGYQILPQLKVKSTNGKCLDFHLWYCAEIASSWDACGQKAFVGDVWQVCDNFDIHFSPFISGAAGQHFIRVQARGSGSYSNHEAKYEFSFVPSPAPPA